MRNRTFASFFKMAACSNGGPHVLISEKENAHSRRYRPRLWKPGIVR
jgi:hypothetical protein